MNYLSDSAAALQLSAEEQQSAIRLKNARPPVATNSRAILNSADKVEWYDVVYTEMVRLNIAGNDEKTRAFCDLAGVAD